MKNGVTTAIHFSFNVTEGDYVDGCMFNLAGNDFKLGKYKDSKDSDDGWSRMYPFRKNGITIKVYVSWYYYKQPSDYFNFNKYDCKGQPINR